MGYNITLTYNFSKKWGHINIQSNTPFFFNQSSNHPILLWSGVALFLALLNILIAKFLYKCAKKILHKKG